MTTDDEQITGEPFTIVARSAEDFAAQHPIMEGRVSPHRMLDAPGARIMQLAFDAGIELREHKAPAPILIQAMVGAVTVTAKGRDVVLEPGGVVHLEAGVPHAVVAHAGSARIMLVLLR